VYIFLRWIWFEPDIKNAITLQTKAASIPVVMKQCFVICANEKINVFGAVAFPFDNKHGSQ
jgi:hypothetical protein